MRQERTLEKVTRHTVLVRTKAIIHLRQVSRKLGKLIASRSDIRLWHNNLAPGPQTPCWLPLKRSSRHLARLVAYLIFKANTQQLILLLLNLTRLLCRRDSSKQTLNTIQ